MDQLGPLAGVRVIEITGTGALPFGAMLLADMGADVVRVDRADGARPIGAGTVLDRGRRSVALDLKHPEGPGVVLRLCERADVLLEGFRPGVAERLGIGPGPCRERNPRLVYGRLTGFGRGGPLANAPGHDINFVALSGVLNAIGGAAAPAIPLNLMGDFAGGGLTLAYGIVCALVERARTGVGRVVDAAMVDGVSTLAAPFHAYAGRGWSEQRGANPLDGAAHFYNVYECADGRWVAVGAIEPQFYAALLRALGLEDEDLPHQMDAARWPEMRARFAEIFASRTRDEWCALLEGTDALLSPVLTFTEARAHPQNAERDAFVANDGVAVPAPPVAFDGTRPPSARGIPSPGAHTDEVLRDLGWSPAEIEELRSRGAIT